MTLGGEQEFNVKRPQTQITAITTTETLTAVDATHQQLQFGKSGADGFAGITFTADPLPSNFPGRVQWVQIIDSTFQKWRRRNGEEGMRSDSNMLDTSYPYPAVGQYFTNDSPGATLDTTDISYYQVGDQFTMYLMYQATPNSIWVPLRKVSWSWYGIISDNGAGGWELDAAGNADNPLDEDTLDFPIWNRVFTP